MIEETETFLEFRDDNGNLISVAKDIQINNDQGEIKLVNSSPAAKNVKEITKEQADQLSNELMA